MTVFQRLDQVWQSRKTSIVGYALIGLAGLATPQGHAILSYAHVSGSIQNGIDLLQNYLVVTGLGLSARGMGPLGPSASSTPPVQPEVTVQK